METPEVFVGNAKELFDAEANLTGEAATGELRPFLAAYRTWPEEIAVEAAAA